MIALDPDKRRRLIASARLLESDKKGEREAALEAVLRLLPEGVTIADALAKALPETVVSLFPWRDAAALVIANSKLFSARDLDFAVNMRTRRACPTERQWKWLNDLVASIDERVAA